MIFTIFFIVIIFCISSVFIHDTFCLCLLQIRFASVDLKLHTDYVPGGAESIFDVDRRVSERTQVIPPLPEDRFLCGFSHIFAGLLLLSNLQLLRSVPFLTSYEGIYLCIYLCSMNVRWICSWVLQLQGISHSFFYDNLHSTFWKEKKNKKTKNSFAPYADFTFRKDLFCVLMKLTLFVSGLRCCLLMLSLHLRMRDWITAR